MLLHVILEDMFLQRKIGLTSLLFNNSRQSFSDQSKERFYAPNRGKGHHVFIRLRQGEDFLYNGAFPGEAGLNKRHTLLSNLNEIIHLFVTGA